MSKWSMRFFLIFFMGLFSVQIAGAAPKVVATIKPLHSLVSAITKGVTEVDLMLTADISPHDFTLKPSMAHMIQNADIIFWIGPDMETALQDPIKNMAQDAVIVDFSEFLQGLSPHIWLDPQDAMAMVQKISEQLSALDPQNAPIYQKNQQEYILQLGQLEADLQVKLAPIQGKPFISYHDAYDHFVARFKLNELAAITISETQKPGARRLREMGQLIDQNNVKCIFAEPQFETRTIAILTDGRSIQTGILDPLGINIDAGPDQYAALLHQLADSLVSCLER